MNSTPLVSVVITNYNYGRYLSECIDSVLTQTYPTIDVIVVDDGSTDTSLAVLQHFSSRITIISQRNKGVSAARNAGIFKSKGEWVAFLDADDAWRPEKLQEQSEYFADSSVGMIFCGLEYVDDDGTCLGYAQAIVRRDILSQLVTFSSPPIGGGSTAVVRADLLRTLGGFDESLSAPEDLDMWIRIAAEHEIRAVTAPLVKYRRHSGSLGSKVDLFESNNYRVLTKAFSNPTCARVRHLRRRSFGRFYMIVAGYHFQERNLVQAIRYTSKALIYRPLEAIHLLGLPVRFVRRHCSQEVANRDWSRSPIRVLHVTSLETANYFLNNLVDDCDHRMIEFFVVTLTGEGTFATELRRRGVTVYCLDCNKRSKYLKALRNVVSIICRHHVDVVHAHLVEPTWIGLTAARLMALPAIATRHHSDAIYRIENSLKRWGHLRLEQCTRALADHIIAPSICVKDLLLRREGTPTSKVTLIPYGQDFRRFQAVTEMNVFTVRKELGMEKPPVLVCVSRLDRLKGHVFLFEAVAALRSEFPDLTLYLVGVGPDRSRIEEAALTVGIAGKVTFLGWRDDALAIMAAADVVVHPSLTEALSSVVIEALALAKPVVATDVSGVRDTLEGHGRIVPPADSSALADAIRSTLVNLEAANRLAASGRTRLFESMRSSKVAQAHIEVYRSVLTRPLPLLTHTGDRKLEDRHS
jgi:glycosyltransferase involved in cell wall biosynthesis